MADRRKQLRLEIEAIVRGAQRVRDLSGDMDRLDRQTRDGLRDPTPKLRRGLTTTQRVARGAAAALSLVSAALVAREYVQATNQFQRLIGQLKVVEGSQAAANERFAELKDIANETFAALDGTVQIYARLARSNEQLGASQEELLAFTRATNQAIAASGANAQEAAAATIQLAQGLASGELRGEELRSVMEQLPRLAIAIADGIGVDGVGALRDMAEQGKLTSEVVFGAILDQQDEIAREFEQLPKRVDQALTQLGNDLVAAFGQADVEGLVEAIDEFREIVTDPGFVGGVNTLAEAIFGLASSAAEAAAIIGNLFEIIGDSIGATAAAFMAAAQGDFERAWSIIQENGEDTVGNLRDMRDLLFEIIGLSEEAAAAGGSGSGGSTSGGGGGGADTGGGETITSGFTPNFGSGRRPGALTPEQLDLIKRGAAVFEETRTAAERYRAELRRLDELLDEGAITKDTYNRAVQQAAEAFQKAEEKAKESTEEMSEFAEQAARNMQDAFADFLFDPFEDGVEGMVEAFSRAIRRMVAEALAARILDESAIGQLFTSFLSGGGSTTTTSANASGTGSNPYVATVNHAGGMAGGGGVSRRVSPGLFIGAPRFHGGGVVPRLRPGEVPAILRQDEEVLTRGDPRHQANAGGVSGRVQVQLVNEGTAKEADREAEVSISPEGMVIRIMLQDFKRGGPVSEGILNLTGSRRGGG